MASKVPTVGVVKTKNSTRPQYSVEVIDPDKLPLTLLRPRPQWRGAEIPACTQILSKCPPVMNSTEILASPKYFTFFPLLPPELRIKIWKLAMRPRIVIKQVHYDNAPKPIFTPGIPVLMHTSVEARKIALENYSTFKENQVSYGDGRVKCLEAPTTFNFELDTLLSLLWDGRAFHINDALWHPIQITSKLRHVCIRMMEFDDILFWKKDPCPRAEKVEAAYDMLRRFNKLESISLFSETRGYLRSDRPWKVRLVDDMPERVFGSSYNSTVWTWDGSQARSLEIYTKHLKEIERAHPEWMAPELKFVRVEYIDLFTKCTATIEVGAK